MTCHFICNPKQATHLCMYIGTAIKILVPCSDSSRLKNQVLLPNLQAWRTCVLNCLLLPQSYKGVSLYSITAIRGPNKPPSVFTAHPTYLFKLLWSSTNCKHDLLWLETKSWICYCMSTCPYSSKTLQGCFYWVQNSTTGQKYDSVGQHMWGSW